MIHILFGASGTGKGLFCEIVREMEKSGKKISLHIKGTTRQMSNYDGSELINHYLSDNKTKEKLTPKNIRNHYDYVYQQIGEKNEYGIQQKQIDEAISKNEAHFIICNDIDTINQIRERNRTKEIQIRLLYLMYNADETEIKRQIKAKIKEEASKYSSAMDEKQIIEARYARIAELHKRFVENAYMFDGVIFNKFNAGSNIVLSISNLRRQIHFEANYCDNCFAMYKPNTVFVIKPMRKLYEDQPDFFDKTREIIKKTCDSLGLKYINYEGKHADKIINEIHNGIAKAEYIIADFSGNLPNCYYEYGIAEKLEKKVILIRDERTKLEFDLSQIFVEEYNLETLSTVIERGINHYKKEKIG